ncbi:MAG: 30S ribosomal protein S8 [Deltaproteobacteria bacterium]|nr:30S ribosomal protein S8 [Deltaproteobacteria bacterium]
MSHTDPIADLLTRIRNAAQAGFQSTAVPYSALKEQVAQLLYREGYLDGVEIVTSDQRKQLVITMKYGADRRRVIAGLERVSRPGRRIYKGYAELKQLRSGLGVTILSTPRGILTDTTAKKLKVGGEILCRVW